MSVASIHGTAFIGDGVVIGNNVTVGPGAVLTGPMTIDDDCWIGANAVLGAPPEISTARHNRAWEGDLDHKGVHIGARTIIRELATIHQGWLSETIIGEDCLILNSSYVAHDCRIESGVTLSASVSLGGYVKLGRSVTIGMNATVHQRRVIGPGAMIGMGAAVTRDVPPFLKAFGVPARIRSVNNRAFDVLSISDVSVKNALIRAIDEGFVDAKTLDPISSHWQWWLEASPEHSAIELR